MLRRRRRRSPRRAKRWARHLVRISNSNTVARALEAVGRQNKRLEVIWRQIPIRGLPLVFDGFRICQITDVHHGPFVDLDYVGAVVDRANQLEPDISVLTGDYVSHNPVFIAPCIEALSRLNAPMGVYGVLGNHDHWEGAEIVHEEFERFGIVELTNTGVTLKRSKNHIYVAGVDDLWAGRPDLNAALAKRKQSPVTILLSHNPDFAERIPAEADVDLVLSGHTHGGQIQFARGRPAPYPSRFGRKYLSGLVHAPNTTVYVSRGIGVSAFPVRVFCPPELTVIELIAADES